jgi:phosphoribosylpyrophosphate synthetase
MEFSAINSQKGSEQPLPLRSRSFSDHSPVPEKEWKIKRESKMKLRQERQYVVFCASIYTDLAIRLQQSQPDRFKYFPIHWAKYPDGTDNITIEGFNPENEIAGEHVLFLASFHNNDVTLSQFSVFIVLLQSFIESLTILLPYYPVGTNERVEVEGRVATANTYSMLLSNLPSIGKPCRLMIYDIHTLQNRFYFHSSTIPSLHTSIPLLLKRLVFSSVNAICFPDEGAAKRFASHFKKAGYDIIICGKVRDGEKRIVKIQDGDSTDKSIVIVDDLVQTGGTLHECGLALLAAGAKEVNAFAAHAVFPNHSWKAFCRHFHGHRAIFQKIWVTNSIPTITNQFPSGDVFEVLDLTPMILHDLDAFC